MTKRNEKLEEEIVKVRNVLKQAEEEIRRQDQAIQVKLCEFLAPSSEIDFETRHSMTLMTLSLMLFDSFNILYMTLNM